MEEATMDEHVQQEINEILAHLDAQEDTATFQPSEGQQETEVVDVFIVHRQVEDPEPPTVEGTLAATSDEQEIQTAPGEQEQRYRRFHASRAIVHFRSLWVRCVS
jgi:hypothetical protein